MQSTSSASSKLQTALVETVQLQEDFLVLVYEHQISSATSGTFKCWTFCSVGLADKGQKEVVFTIKRTASEMDPKAYPDDPFEIYKLLLQLAGEGRTVNVEWSFTEFTSTGFLGRADFSTILYGPPTLTHDPALEAVLPKDRLHAILLTSAETEAFKVHGVIRTIGSLGSKERWFPFPPYIDPARPDLVTMADYASALVPHKLPLTQIPFVTSYKSGNELFLAVGEESRAVFAKAIASLEDDSAFALESLPFAGADSCLIWKEGMKGATAYARGSSSECLNAAYIAFAPGQKEDAVQLVQDGFVLLVTNDTWSSIRSAISNLKSTSFPIPLSAGISRFSLSFSTSLSSPPPLRSSKHTTSPSDTSAEEAHDGNLQLGSIVFLSEPSPADLSIASFSDYVRRIQSSLEAIMPSGGAPKQLLLQLEVQTGNKAVLGLQVVNGNDDFPIEEGKARVASEKVPDLKEGGKCIVQLFFNAWGWSAAEDA